MRPQSAKAKGRTFQQWTRDLILSTFPSLESDDVKSTSMGAGGEDIQLSPAARKLVPYQIECKSKRDSAAHTMYEQAKSHGNREPLVFIKKDRSIPLVIMSAEHFLGLLKTINENKPSN